MLEAVQTELWDEMSRRGIPSDSAFAAQRGFHSTPQTRAFAVLWSRRDPALVNAGLSVGFAIEEWQGWDVMEPLLLDGLTDADPRFRTFAIMCLSVTNDARLLPQLRLRLNDSDLGVRGCAKLAIEFVLDEFFLAPRAERSFVPCCAGYTETQLTSPLSHTDSRSTSTT